MWKTEVVTPIPKVPHPTSLKQLRKICGTSDYSKLYESFIKQWIIEDVYPNIDPSQYGDEKGIGTEHILVYFLDRILKMLDSPKGKSAVIAASCDWSEAFDRQDPFITTVKFIKLNLRPSLVTVLISYMSNRKMIVKWRGKVSTQRGLVGGSAQGSLLGGSQYIVGSSDVGSEIPYDDKYRYFDDLEVLELIMLSGLLINHDVEVG